MINTTKPEQYKQKPRKKTYLKFSIVIIIGLMITVSLIYLIFFPSLFSDDSGLIINKTYVFSLWQLNIINIDYDDLSDAEKSETINSFNTTTNSDYDSFLSQIPEIYTERKFYCSKIPVDHNNKIYKLHDYVFHFRTEKEAHITIKICPFEKPLKDIGFTPLTSVKSEINSTEITVFGVGKQQTHLITEFIYNGAYYEIEAYKISAAELEEFLFSIL